MLEQEYIELDENAICLEGCIGDCKKGCKCGDCDQSNLKRQKNNE